MAEDAKELARTIGRGRRESTPWYFQMSVLLVVTAIVAVVMLGALLAFYLT